jgi:hypothetical protein
MAKSYLNVYNNFSMLRPVNTVVYNLLFHITRALQTGEGTRVIINAELQGREVVVTRIFDAMRAHVQDVHQSKSDTATMRPERIFY